MQRRLATDVEIRKIGLRQHGLTSLKVRGPVSAGLCGIPVTTDPDDNRILECAVDGRGGVLSMVPQPIRTLPRFRRFHSRRRDTAETTVAGWIPIET